jgi:glycerophosphoryl diester phosphodiesterase
MRVVAAAVLGLAWVAAAGPVFAQGGSATLYAAHRGGGLLWPENSLFAFKNAVALGADFIEFDVHLSKDGEVVVIHDPTLGRTTTGQGPVRDRTLAELRALRLKTRSGAVSEETLPTLDEVVTVAADGRRRMLLEIKVDDRGQRYPGIEEKVIAILDRHAMAPSTVVMAFEADTWRRVHELRRDLTAGALYSTRTIRSMGSSASRALAEAGAAGARFVGLHEDLVDADAVAAARTAGVMLGVWTVNEPAALRRFIAARVGVVITDRPDLAKELLGR